MDSGHVRISIIIPTYNRAGLLPETIRSVLDQAEPEVEVIVADDASTDNTAKVVAPFVAAGQVRYEVGPHQGPAGTRNAGVRAARGELIGFLDSDDRYLPGGLAAHARAFAQQPDLGLTIAGCEYVDAGGQHLSWRTPWSEGGELSLRGWLFNCFGMPGTIMVRRAWFERAEGFDPSFAIAEDWHLFMRLALLGCTMTWVRAITCQYRQHGSNSSLRLELHRVDAHQALDSILGDPGLDAEVARLGPAAHAWVQVVFARRALAAGQTEQARGWLREALLLDPRLGADRRATLTETLLSPPASWLGTPTSYALSAALHLPPELRPTQVELRHISARLEMRGFFEAVGRGHATTAHQHLGRGLRQDLRWLTNRGVLSFLVQGRWRHTPARRSAGPHA